MAQVRQALQHAVAMGACSTARLTTGSRRVVARSNNPSECSRLRREWYSSRSGECRGEACEHHEISVEPDALDPANPERGESVVVLQASELALDGGPRPLKRSAAF